MPGSGIVERNPLLNYLEPDIEALLVNRVGRSRGAAEAEYFFALMDDCYKLVGLIRTHWKGLSGGKRGVGGDWRIFLFSAAVLSYGW